MSPKTAQGWAQAVHVSTLVQICEPLHSSRRFLIESAVFNFSHVLLISTQGSAVTLKRDQHYSTQLLLPYNGLGTWRIERDVCTTLLVNRFSPFLKLH